MRLIVHSPSIGIQLTIASLSPKAYAWPVSIRRPTKVQL